MHPVRNAVGAVAAAALIVAAVPSAALAAQPTIESESVSNVTETDATLETTLNITGVEPGAYYQFELAQSPGELAPEFTCPVFHEGEIPCFGAPQEAGSLPVLAAVDIELGGTNPAHKSLELTGLRTLTPDTNYYYRVITAQAIVTVDSLRWVKPAVQGPIQSFKTAGPPGATTVHVSATGHTTAIMDGAVEPNGASTAVHADYALASEPWCTSHGAAGTPSETAPTALGPLSGVVFPVPVKLEGLSPGREYCAELVAHNEFGTALGGQVSFATPALIETAEYNNWVLGGSLTDKRQGQAITLPAGATFNGTGEINDETGAGSVRGNLSIPAFSDTVRLFGILPMTFGITIAEAAPLEGTIASSAAGAGEETLTIPTKLTLGVSSVGILGLSVPVQCTTTEPLGLTLTDTLTREELLHKGWSFSGTTTLPRFSCKGGFLGGLVGMALTMLLSGPENPYSLTVTAPGG
jgi:hypothetical protein